MDRLVYEKCCVLTTRKFIDFHVNQSLAINGNEQFVWVVGVLKFDWHYVLVSEFLQPSSHKFWMLPNDLLHPWIHKFSISILMHDYNLHDVSKGNSKAMCRSAIIILSRPEFLYKTLYRTIIIQTLGQLCTKIHDCHASFFNPIFTQGLHSPNSLSKWFPLFVCCNGFTLQLNNIVLTCNRMFFSVIVAKFHSVTNRTPLWMVKSLWECMEQVR